MKLSKRATKALGCCYLAGSAILLLAQIVLLTMKIVGAISWSWWLTLLPIICIIGLPFAVVVIAVLVEMPLVLIDYLKWYKRVEAEAAKYGMKRKPGESAAELKQRIYQRKRKQAEKRVLPPPGVETENGAAEATTCSEKEEMYGNTSE